MISPMVEKTIRLLPPSAPPGALLCKRPSYKADSVSVGDRFSFCVIISARRTRQIHCPLVTDSVWRNDKNTCFMMCSSMVFMKKLKPKVSS